MTVPGERNRKGWNVNLSEVDAYALARALQGLEPVELIGVSPLVQMLVENWRGRRPDSRDIETARGFFGQSFVAQVFAANPNAAPPTSLGHDDYVPSLPKAAQFTEKPGAPRAGGWLDMYMQWAKGRASMTDELFLEAGGLWLLSMATARRAVLELDFGLIYNPLYVLWCAGTTYWRKSTGLRAVELIARRTIPHLMLAAQATPEMLMSRLAGEQPINFDKLSSDVQSAELAGAQYAGQRGFISDEVTKLFSKKYMEGLPEVLMEMYDNPPVVEQEFKTQGRLIVRSPGLSLLFATTPARLGSVFGDGEWEDGLLPRFALLTPTSSVVRRTHTQRAGAQHEPPVPLLKGIRGLYDSLPEPDNSSTMDGFAHPVLRTEKVEISDVALERFNLYADALHDFTGPHGGIDERLTGVYGRLPIMGLKIAMSLMLIDDAMHHTGRTIEAAHWARAQSITEKWRSSAHRLLSQLNRSGDQKCEDQVLDFLRMAHSRPPNALEIMRGARIRKRADAYAAIDALKDAGLIMEVETGGRKGFIQAKGV